MLATPTDNPAEQSARRVWRQVGSPDPRESLQVIAQRLGHAGGQVEQTVAQTRWFSWCACGFVSTTRNTEADALGALVHHLKLALRAWTRSQLPLEAYPPAPTADWERVAKMHPHWALKRASDTPEERRRLNLPDNVRAG